MPTLFIWMGFKFYFYSKEHEPIHVHVEYAERQTIFELIIVNGKVVSIEQRDVAGYEPLTAKEAKQALKLIRKYKMEIIQLWFDFFVLQKNIKTKNIRTNFLP